MKFQAAISNIGKPVNVSEALINRTSKWVAQHFGVSLRTAQKWKAGTQQPGKKAGGPQKVIKSANAATRRKVAANAIRSGSTVHVGNVTLKYEGKRPHTQRINQSWAITPAMRERLNRAADALERGDMATAGREMSAAVVNRYGGDSGRGGLGNILSIEDWGVGFDVT